MRKSPWLKLWLFVFVTALAIGGGLTVGVWRSRAASPALWTESHQTVPSGNPPWVEVAEEDTPAVVPSRLSTHCGRRATILCLRVPG
jgi:hypothetical protein